jgi:hypothetical protein
MMPAAAGLLAAKPLDVTSGTSSSRAKAPASNFLELCSIISRLKGGRKNIKQ